MIIADPSGNTTCGFSTLGNPEHPEKETPGLDMRLWGNIIYEKALNLSRKVNRELLEPISKWLDDPDFMKRHAVVIENDIPNWAEYKRRQRKWTEQQRKLAAQRLRLYWQEIHARKRHKKYINSLIPRGSPRPPPMLDTGSDFLSPIVAPFSPLEQTRQETLKLFQQARTLSITNLLPWRILITSELKEPKTLNELPEYTDYKQDKIAKLQHILHLEMEGRIRLRQNIPFGKITIELMDIPEEKYITIKDQCGQEYLFDWNDLSDNQRNKIIADIKANKVLCRAV